MKQSGIDWIGEIPDDWKTRQIRYLFSLRDERNYKPLSEVNLISVYTDKGVLQHSDIEQTTGNKAQNADGYKHVYKNDLVVNIILCWMGALGISDFDGVTSPAYDVYAPKDLNTILPKYYHYLFRTPQFNGKCYTEGRGIMQMRWRTYSSEFKSIKVPLPPKATQQRIAEYLDSKCAQIDSIIEESKKSIEEYKAWKQSVIFEAVTGKNLNCKKKDSGIEWIGEIPEGWSTIKFKYLHSGSNVGESIDKELCNDNENDTVFYTAGLNPIHTIYKQFPIWKYTKQNDLLLARNGTPYVYNPLTNAVYSDHIIRVTIKDDYSKKYVQYAIQQSIFNIVVDTVSITTWSASLWNNQFIPLPPRNIQEKIVEIIENKLNKINSLILEKESLIADLTEYKKSLIFEVVTGKRSV